MAEKQTTKKEHFVPQTYLEGFSQRDKRIYEYNLKSKAAIEKPVPIRSICWEEELYEVKDESGTIIHANYLENTLGNFEGQFSEHRRKLLRKARLKENCQTRCFLSEEEKDFWVFFATLHIMRNPATLYGMQAVMRESVSEVLSENETNNAVLAYCLPFFKRPEKGELNALTGFISSLKTKAIKVGYAESDHLFTSDHGMYGFRNTQKDPFDFGTLWFPLSSDCVIIFFDPKSDRTQRNRLVHLSEEEVRELNKGIAYIASQMVLSKYPFSKADIQLIEEARSERAQDDEQTKTHPVD